MSQCDKIVYKYHNATSHLIDTIIWHKLSWMYEADISQPRWMSQCHVTNEEHHNQTYPYYKVSQNEC